MSGYVSKVHCKGKRSDRFCRSYKSTSPSGKWNGHDMDDSGYCADCRRVLGLSDGQLRLMLVG